MAGRPEVDLDVFDAAGRLGDRRAVLRQAFQARFDRLADEALDLLFLSLP